MPYPSVEPHDWRLEWIIIGYPNVYNVCAPFIRRTARSLKRAFEVCKIIAITDKICCDLGGSITLDVGNLFRDAAVTVAHGGKGDRVDVV